MQTMLWMLLLELTLHGSLKGVLSEVCSTGKYESNGDCIECPNSCQTCLSEFQCLKCQPGFYGEACSKNCSNVCKDGLCLKSSGNCISCVEGSFLNGVSVCENCPEHCTICDSRTRCTVCAVGFKGDICQESCINCKLGTGCSKDTGICTNDCKDGYSGISCGTKCNSKCQSCNRQDPDACTSCASGKYGFECEKACSKHCQDNYCNTKDGVCTHGCINGFWDNMCENVCPTNCLNNECFRHNGFCSNGCEGNYTGSRCTCPSGCTCNSNGSCETCSQESGSACDQSCGTRSCLHGCRDGYSEDLCSPANPDAEIPKKVVSSGLVTALIVLGVLIPVLIIMITVFLVRRRRNRRQRSSRGKDSRTPLARKENADVDTKIDVENRTIHYYQETKPVMKKESKDEDSGKKVNLQINLQTIPSIPSESTQLLVNADKEASGEKTENPDKNQKVIWKRGPTDYMQACFIDGLMQQNEYIACTGPTAALPGSIALFWSMLWEERCEVIVMLADLLEEGEQTCSKYWPNEKEFKQYGNITVKCCEEKFFDDFYKRNLTIIKSSDERHVVQWQYVKWQKDVPDCNSFIDLLRMHTKSRTQRDFPLVIQCSKDNGRSATYIALDILFEQGKKTNYLDFSVCVERLLNQGLRVTKEQYDFIHKALQVWFNKDKEQSALML